MYFNINFAPAKTQFNTILPNKNIQNRTYIKAKSAVDTFTFTGRSEASQYGNVFEYLAAGILEAKSKKYGVNGGMLSSNNITATVDKLFDEDKIFLPYPMTLHEKIKWKNYIPQDIREGSVEKINQARVARMNDWQNFLENPEKVDAMFGGYNDALVKKIKNNNALKLVIWNAVTSELKENNRHIPVPFNEKALLETIEGFEEIKPKDRAVRCASPSFLDMYTHRLRDNLLMDMGLSNNDEVWVKIPSIKHDKANKDKNIARLEILSCKNWCTRSSVDKAEDALLDGDFYIYLSRDKFNLWEPLVGMASSKGKIDQIQGVVNDNIVPLALVDEIKSFIEDSNLKCHTRIVDEGPKAEVALFISEKLNEVDPLTKKSFAKSIKEQDDVAMFKHLGVQVKVLPNGKLEIPGYRPSYLMNSEKGLAIPYSMFGINEDVLLRNVEVINGNFVLNHNKNNLYTSRITEFPPSLNTVKGRVVCNSNQFERFGEDIKRVVDFLPSKYIVQK